MQFHYNSDYPATGSDGAEIPAEVNDPTEFPRAQPISCARITTRIFHPSRNQVATVQNVLVRTVMRPVVKRTGSTSSMSSDGGMSSSSDESMAVDQPQDASSPGAAATAAATTTIEDNGHNMDDRAYWIQRTVREAIYGRVLLAVVLRRRSVQSDAPNDNAEWEVTTEHCAVKEMSWQHIRRERDRLAEDPIKEVSAMQYLKQWHTTVNAKASKAQGEPVDGVAASFKAILETNIMMPLDLLSDDRNLYSVMPYCDGGELFERLDLNERFSEEEARYWMHQVLNGLEHLQNAGICHRDMSLENLLVHESGALIIDLGMCLRIPFRGDPQKASSAANLSSTFGNMDMNSVGDAPKLDDSNLVCRSKPRMLIKPQGTCGKWIYMSPEIYKNRQPFDGYAVDMWAAGVILFLMLTGFPPWERACQTDERFKYMTAGYLVQMLTEWEIGISSDAMDLLQRMLFLDPKDRLSLDQVRAHPWMANGRNVTPPGLDGLQRA